LFVSNLQIKENDFNNDLSTVQEMFMDKILIRNKMDRIFLNIIQIYMCHCLFLSILIA